MEGEPVFCLHAPPFMNDGVLLGRRNTDYVAGTLPYVVENPSGDWTNYLPLGEWQWIQTFDSMACVTFSALNVIETLYYFRTGQRKNFSDRFTATMSGTTHDGNYCWKVGDSIRKDGLVEETLWPTPQNATWGSYYTAPTIEVVNKAKEFLNSWTVNYEEIDPTRESLLHHIKQSPIQAIMPGHAVMNFYNTDSIYKYFDSYDPFVKERTLDFVSAYKYVLTKKPMFELFTSDGKKVYAVFTGVDGVKYRSWVLDPSTLSNGSNKHWKANVVQDPSVLNLPFASAIFLSGTDDPK